MLISRKYNKKVINDAIKRALNLDRIEALKKVQKANRQSDLFGHLQPEIAKCVGNTKEALENNDTRPKNVKSISHTANGGL